MPEALTVELLFQLAGEPVARGLQLPVPGPVVGLIALFAFLRFVRPASAGLRQLAESLHGHMSLLFVPAGVGVMLYLPQLAREWLVILVAVAVLLLIALLSTTGVEYPRYFEDAQFVHFLLGPATVALAVSLIDHLATLRRYRGPCCPSR